MSSLRGVRPILSGPVGASTRFCRVMGWGCAFAPDLSGPNCQLFDSVGSRGGKCPILSGHGLGLCVCASSVGSAGWGRAVLSGPPAVVVRICRVRGGGDGLPACP